MSPHLFGAMSSSKPPIKKFQCHQCNEIWTCQAGQCDSKLVFTNAKRYSEDSRLVIPGTPIVNFITDLEQMAARCSLTVHSPVWCTTARKFCTNGDEPPSTNKLTLTQAEPREKRNKRRRKGRKRVSNDEELEIAAADVALALTGNKQQIQSELIAQLRHTAAVSEAQKSGMSPALTVSESEQPSKSSQPASEPSSEFSIITSLFKQKTKEIPEPPETSEKPQKFDSGVLEGLHVEQNERRSDGDRRAGLYEGPGLNIFTKPTEQGVPAEEETLYDVLTREHNEMELNYPPSNAYEEMMKLTKEHKTWTFPIDNEQGMDEEKKVGFHEHVFLDHLLKKFPNKGPIRHFMELVIVGLSKNPYLTVQQKHEHVAWYEEYFKDKYVLLQGVVETGAKGDMVG